MDCLEEDDTNETVNLLKKRSVKLDLFIYNGLYAHLPKIEHDSVGEQIAAFVDYNKIAVMPLLH